MLYKQPATIAAKDHDENLCRDGLKLVDIDPSRHLKPENLQNC